MEVMYKFLTQTRRERIIQRSNVENNAYSFDWQNLIRYYDAAYDLALNNKH
jgi:glycogen(starch) synthase